MASFTDQVAAIVRKMVGPLKARVDGMIVRTVLGAVSDSGGFQVVRVSDLDELLDRVEHLQQGGVSHHALADAEGLLLKVSGRRNHPVAILCSNRNARPKNIAPGETILYIVGGANAGTKVHCKANGEVWLGSQSVDTDFVALAAKVDDFISRIDAVIRTAWVVVPNDGGAALKTAYTTEFDEPPESVAAEHVKAD